MTDQHLPEPQLTADIRTLLAETPWNIAIVARDGTLLAISRPLLDLLDTGEEHLAGQSLEALVLPGERLRLHALLDQARHGLPPRAIRAHLSAAGRVPVAVELELSAPAADTQHLAVVIYPISIMHRREQITLEFNRMVPLLLLAQSPDDLYRRASSALRPLGLGLLVMALDPGADTLRIEYLSTHPRVIALLKRGGQLDLAQMHIPLGTPFVRDVIERRHAVFLAHFRPLIEALLPARETSFLMAWLWAVGGPACIMAPLLDGAEVRGVLLVWGHVLSQEQAPFIEAFAHQLAALHAQIELRAEMQRQMLQLISLAATAQAVTSLGSLDAVLRAVCEQAYGLFDANFVAIAQPVPGQELLECLMVHGDNGARWIGARASYDSSIAGQVMRSGKGICVPSVAAEPRVHAAFRSGEVVGSTMAQPLLHQGVIFGVLTVGHRTAGRFSTADLDHLGRYAEYAAVAIANAQLHSALQQSEAEQGRQRRELAALLQFSNAINASLDLETVLHAGLRMLDELALITMGSVYLARQQGSLFELHAAHNMSPEFVGQFTHILRDRLTLGGTILDSGQVQIIGPREIEQLNQLYPALGQLGLTGIGVAPLVAEGQLLGALIVNRADGRTYDESDQRLLDAVAQQLAQAVAKAQVHKALHSSAAANATLYREAEAMRSYLNTLIQNTPDLLVMIRADLTLHVINPERLVSSRLGGIEIEARSVLELTPARLHAELNQRWQAVQRGQPQIFELDLSDINDKPLHVLLSATLIADYGQVFVIVRDVTDQHERTAHVHQAEKLAALGRMVAGAAHELNNPLATILGLAQLQLDDQLPPELHADFEKIERAALRARAIVQQLLSFARPQPPQTEPVWVGELVAETLERLSGALQAAQVGVEIGGLAELPPVEGDPHQLGQVLFNIINNAVQSLAGVAPEARRLSIRAQAQADGLLIEIEDSGLGVEPGNLAHIFEPFFTTRAVGQGAGLGLAISYAIIQQHNGELWVSSQPGRGATFCVQLPLARVPIAGEPAPQLARNPFTGTRILVVADEQALRDVAARALAGYGFRVDTASSGAEALERAQHGEYQLLISDLHMPGIDGQTLYARLRPQQPALRWMILTDHTLSERSRHFLERTRLPALAKPFTAEQLMRQVSACLDSSLAV